MRPFVRRCLFLLVAAGLAAWALQGAAQQDLPAGAGPATLDAEEVAFLQQAAVIGLAGMQAAAIAERRATNDDTRNFAARMRTDHGAAHEQLRLLAARKVVTLPIALDDARMDMLDALEEEAAKSFDAAYARHMLREHEAAVALYAGIISKSQDRELLEFARRSLEVLKHHLEMAQQLEAA